MHFPLRYWKEQLHSPPQQKRIRYKFGLEFKVFRLNNLKGVSLEVMDIVGKCFVLLGETIKFY
jgi:hypothetical protein